MGIAFVLLGILGGALVADVVLENWRDAVERTFSVMGGSFTLTDTQVVLAAAAVGVASVLFLALGLSLLRGSRGRRRAARHRIAELERENAELRARRTAPTVPQPPPARVERSPREQVGADRTG